MQCLALDLSKSSGSHWQWRVETICISKELVLLLLLAYKEELPRFRYLTQDALVAVAWSCVIRFINLLAAGYTPWCTFLCLVLLVQTNTWRLWET